MLRRQFLVAASCFLFLICVSVPAFADEPSQKVQIRKIVLAHYMPWFVAKPSSERWGWHWTMNAFDPDQQTNGKRQIASHYYPLIGPYDSGDPSVLEYHLLLMKLAGIDGVIVDWYGLQNFRDYAILHRNTQRVVEQCSRLGLSFAICYEDQTIPALVSDGRIAKTDRVSHAAAEIEWMAKNWFSQKGYVKQDGQPILLSFGNDGLTDDEWKQCLSLLTSPVLYFSEHRRRLSASGAFDWPLPKKGLKAQEQFEIDSATWPHSISTAFPRFIDIYAEAKVHASWGRIEDENGAVLKTTFERALKGRSGIIQIATWNDWGEGTGIEPCVEFGYRDLEIVQQLRRTHIDPTFAPKADDLKLARRLYELRSHTPVESDSSKRLNEISRRLASGEIEYARQAIDAAEK